MIDRLKNELLKISDTKETYQYLQNNDEFLSIIFVIDSYDLNAFISIDCTPIRCSNTAKGIKINSILNSRQLFSDGSTFDAHFATDRKIGKG